MTLSDFAFHVEFATRYPLDIKLLIPTKNDKEPLEMVNTETRYQVDMICKKALVILLCSGNPWKGKVWVIALKIHLRGIVLEIVSPSLIALIRENLYKGEILYYIKRWNCYILVYFSFISCINNKKCAIN